MDFDQPGDQGPRKPTITAQVGWRPILQFAVFVILLPLALFAGAGQGNVSFSWANFGLPRAKVCPTVA